jgi:hypothetical protein
MKKKEDNLTIMKDLIQEELLNFVKNMNYIQKLLQFQEDEIRRIGLNLIES